MFGKEISSGNKETQIWHIDKRSGQGFTTKKINLRFAGQNTN